MARNVRKPRVKRDRMMMPASLKARLGIVLHRDIRYQFLLKIADLGPPTDEGLLMIKKALGLADTEFDGMFRDGGELYLQHLICTALILIEYLRCRDPDLICAALLHDLLEDKKDWNFERLKDEFNTQVAELVWWNTREKPKRGQTKEDAERAFHTKLRAAPREAIMIRLPERLHNLMTLWHRSAARNRRKISETKDFYLPLAERHNLMIYAIEDQLRFLERTYLK